MQGGGGLVGVGSQEHMMRRDAMHRETTGMQSCQSACLKFCIYVVDINHLPSDDTHGPTLKVTWQCLACGTGGESDPVC